MFVLSGIQCALLPASFLVAEQKTSQFSHMQPSYLCLPVGVGIYFSSVSIHLSIILSQPLQHPVPSLTLLLSPSPRFFITPYVPLDSYPNNLTHPQCVDSLSSHWSKLFELAKQDRYVRTNAEVVLTKRFESHLKTKLTTWPNFTLLYWFHLCVKFADCKGLYCWLQLIKLSFFSLKIQYDKRVNSLLFSTYLT